MTHRYRLGFDGRLYLFFIAQILDVGIPTVFLDIVYISIAALP